MDLTTAQKTAIYNRGKSLLVSASAGSGKTFVMTKRIVELVVQDKIPITSFLVVTFTKAAAGEMKTKLLKEFEKLPEKTEFIKTQMQEVATVADISTIDGFCAKMLKTYFYKLGLDPAFVVMDEEESTLVKQKAMDALFEKHIEAADTVFFDLADVLQESRSDQKLRDTILKVFEYMRVQVDPAQWQKRVMQQTYQPDLDKNQAARLVVNACTQKLQAVQEALYYLREDAASWESMLRMLNEYNEEILLLRECDTLPKFYNAVNQCISRTSPRATKPEQKPLSDRVKEWKASYKEVLDICSELGDMQTMQQRMQETAPRAQALLQLATEFEEIYTALKKERSAYDFGDLERFTLTLLEDVEVQTEVRNTYKYIFIDEYQDTNYLQEEIISRIAKPDNMFMVGDVKQSIYRFRLCEPQIFIDRLQKYKSKDAQAECIWLNANFRSNKNILDFVNLIFQSVMTKDFGGVDYKNENMLTHGDVPIPEVGTLPSVAAYFIDKGSEQKAELEKPEQGVYSVVNHIQTAPSYIEETDREAIVIARAIQSMVGKPMYDTKTQTIRPIEYQDVVILTASREQVVEPLQRVCMQAGIPLSTDTPTSIFGEDILQVLKNMLVLIHNPYQDIPMLSVLTSSVFQFTLEELSQIRMQYPAEKYYHQAFLLALQKQELPKTILQKIQKYQTFIETYFERSKYLSVAELVKSILQGTMFEQSILMQTDGERKLKTLQIFLQKLESGRYQMLPEFLQNIEKIDMKTAVVEEANAVHITTIHKSKGLEYPVVILAGVAKKANNKDTQADVIFSKKIGIGLKYFQTKERIKNPTIAWLAAKASEETKAREERARLLYVALTRAINHLVVVGSLTKKQLEGKVPKPFRTDNFADWIVYGCKHAKPQLDAMGFKQHVYTVADVEQMAFMGQEEKPSITPGQVQPEMLTYLQKTYPYIQDTTLVTKTTVTKVVEQNTEEVFYPIIYAEETTPQLGTAYHKLMEVLPNTGVTIDVVQQTLERLVMHGFISAKVAEEISLQRVMHAVETLQTLTSEAVSVRKEAEFLMHVAPQDIGMQGAKPILVQGVIDALIETPTEYILVDYKYTAMKHAAQIIQKYQPQLALYARAVRAGFVHKPCKAYIYSFITQKLIEVPV